MLTETSCEHCHLLYGQHLYNCPTLEKQKTENTNMTINSFFGEYRFLSNFWTYPVEFEECVYLSVEHAYQAAKALDISLRVPFQYFLDEDIEKLSEQGIQHVNITATEAKKLSHKLPLRTDWEEVKLGIMEGLLRQKFSFGTELKKQLDATKGKNLIEGNSWHDTWWGCCTCSKHNSMGRNELGKLLMQIRDE